MEQEITQKEALQMLEQMNCPCILQNLVWYAQEGDTNKVKLLLIGGVNPNEPYTNSKKQIVYALHNTSAVGKAEVLELLLTHGANINLQNKDGETALIVAIKNKQTQAVKYLIEKGADVNLRTKDNINALYIAEKAKNTEAVELLRKAGAIEMTQEEIKTYKKREGFAKVFVAIVVIGIAWFIIHAVNKPTSNSGSYSSGSSMSANHTCTYCNQSYSGNGYYHIESSCEQYQTDPGFNAHCSNKCCSDDWDKNGSGRFH